MTQNKVFYESIDEYATLRDQFKTELPELIHTNRIDDWTYHEYGSRDIHFGIKFSNHFEEVLSTALTKLTKAQVPYWVKNTTDILRDAIRGMALSVKYMKGVQQCVECEEMEREHLIEVHDIFTHPSVCNIMIVGMVNNILFDIESDTMDNANGGMLKKISLIACPTCKQIVDDDLVCDYCEECNLVGL